MSNNNKESHYKGGIAREHIKEVVDYVFNHDITNHNQKNTYLSITVTATGGTLFFRTNNFITDIGGLEIYLSYLMGKG